jgi:hypothetical protein
LGEILPFWPKFLTLAEIFDVGRNFWRWAKFLTLAELFTIKYRPKFAL